MLALVPLVLLAVFSSDAPPLSAIAPGWDQVEIESYHGPEGYYLDTASGALVRYYTGPLPDYIGVRPQSGAPCVPQQPQPAPACILEATAKELQVFIGPYGKGVYASYWVPRGSAEQEARGKTLALSNPLSRRLYSGHTFLPRDAQEADLDSIAVGMTLDDVLRLLGDPLTISPAKDVFEMEYVVWGKWPSPTGKLTSASRTVKLMLSRHGIVLNKPRARLPNNETQRTRPAQATEPRR